MATTTRLQASNCSKHVWKYLPTDPPSALVMILGHLGADVQELERLAMPYIDHENVSCAVIAAHSPPFDFVFTRRGFAPVVQAINREVRDIQHEHITRSTTTAPSNNDADSSSPQGRVRSLPIIVHMWSNGGAFLWEELLQQFQQTADPTAPDVISLHVLVDNIHCILFDSCPCYLHMPWNLISEQKQHYWKDAFPFPGWSEFGRKTYLVGASLSLGTWCLLTLNPNRSTDFWQYMTTFPRLTTTCKRIIYLYSTNDKVTDASRIDEMITSQKTKYPNKDIVAYRYEDSAHCKLDRDHPDDYAEAIQKALNAAVADRASK